MSKTIQEVFERYAEKKQQLKIIFRKFKEELSANPEYQKLQEESQKIRAKKRQYEASLNESGTANFNRIDELRLAVAQDRQMLSDMAITALMKGEAIDVKDDRRKFEPVFKVSFRQLKLNV